ncbi:N-acetyltransferase [Cellulomonas chitinilytica]|uniref:N-acetyltransferase n=1 Tax=Cellulomonas chitinilytica TaxID=398759 RepID=A0A919P171_9CELL|nr:GNAT family N-acetyltransferase [Cellulomonas chitinilytica]GIG20785.1 N-acetyltransferase [Cellulomonas chitinilytica]
MTSGGEELVLSIRAARGADHPVWRAMFREYATVGGLSVSDDQTALVWSWVLSDAAQTCCLLATQHAAPAGFVHYRPFERPITASTGLWIDDLYVAPAFRGRGVARALIDAVRGQARAGGHDVVRWSTRESNVDAQRLYERIAARAPVLLYNATP